MEIRIGIANTGRELSFETTETAKAVKDSVAKALESGSAQLTFTDERGSTYIVPTAGLAYVEIGNEESRRVGFVA